jgi:hypothetical protein
MSTAGIHPISHLTFKTEAGGRILTNIILLHVASTLHSRAWRVEVISEFPVEATFKTNSGNCSFSGLVDFVLVHVSPGPFSSKFILHSLYNCVSSISDHLHHSPIHALTATKSMPDTPIIIGTEKNNLVEALPQATVTVASYCKQHRYLSFCPHLT